MRTRWRGGLACLGFGLAGCVGDGTETRPWSLRNPFEMERRFDPASAPTASVKAATRVHAVGSAVAAANAAELPAKPVFLTVGLKEPMAFHQGSAEVIVSEGLVDRCPTDAELAAVLCHELGKLTAKKGPKPGGRADRDLPPAVPVSADVVGAAHTPDMTRAAEEALADRRAQRGGRPARESRPDPKALAQDFFVKAGHSADDFGRMDALLREAEENGEKREIMKGR
jgi:Peptidase family M48